MFKVTAGIALEIVRDISQIEDHRYSFWQSNNVKSANCGIHMTSFSRPRIQDAIPEDCQNANSCKFLKKKILNSWKLLMVYFYLQIIFILCIFIGWIKQIVLNCHRQFFAFYSVVNAAIIVKRLTDWFAQFVLFFI